MLTPHVPLAVLDKVSDPLVYRFPGETELKAQDTGNPRKKKAMRYRATFGCTRKSGEDDVKEFEDKTAHLTQAILRRCVKYC